ETIEISKDADRVELQADEEGKWVVRTLYNLPVDFGKLSAFVQNIVEANIGRRITSLQDRLDRLDLNRGRVRLTSSAGASLVDITYGKSLPGGGTAFLFDQEKTAYQATASPYLDADSTNWAAKVLYEFEADDVAGIQFSLAGETWGIRRVDKGKDFVSTSPSDEKTPKQSEITSVINQIRNLRFTQVDKREEVEATDEWKGARDNTRSLKFTLFSGENITVKMSRYEPPPSEDEEDSTISTTDQVTYLRISSSRADHPINRFMDELTFEASSYTFDNIPTEISELADLPEEPEPTVEASEESIAETEPSPPEVAEAIEEIASETAPFLPDSKEATEGNASEVEPSPPATEEGAEGTTTAEEIVPVEQAEPTPSTQP
ncbi:MAG: DUF4340 domain-containing protein, partial [Opitutae bacterium]|nr:DUF4340 domain-containing protein [Opitutae bacterium]